MVITKEKLLCPNCGFDLLEGNVFGDYVAKLLDHEKEELKLQEEKKWKDFFEKEMENKILKEKNSFSIEIEKLNSRVKEKDNEIKNIKEQLKSEFDLEKQKEIQGLQLKIQRLDLEKQTEADNLRQSLVQVENSFKDQIGKIELQNQVKIEAEKTKISEYYNEQIIVLREKNAQQRILQSKIKGENFEEEVEVELRKSFGMNDLISKVTDNVEGTKPDFLQQVKNENKIVGNIVYEVKRAEWKDSWIDKLAADVIKQKGKFGILISDRINDKFKGVPFLRSDKYDNIFICDPFSFIFIGQIIRHRIIWESRYNSEIENLKREYHQKIGNNDSNVSKLLIEYENKMKELDNFWTIEAPKILFDFSKEIDKLNNVSNSLRKNSDKLDKSIEKIEKIMKNKVQKRLEKILGILNLNSENIDLDSDLEIKNDVSNSLKNDSDLELVD